MEEQFPRFQLSMFTDAERRQQLVVRCNDFEGFVFAIQQVQSLLNGAETTSNSNGAHSGEAEASVLLTSPDFCTIHQQQMVLRTSKDGKQWYDHRWKVEDVWHQCNGKTERVNSNGSK